MVQRGSDTTLIEVNFFYDDSVFSRAPRVHAINNCRQVLLFVNTVQFFESVFFLRFEQLLSLLQTVKFVATATVQAQALEHLMAAESNFPST